MSVLSTHLSRTHTFSKTTQKRGITLLTGLAVKGDCHLGITTQHLWRQNHKNPEYRNELNLRQIHLIQSELFAEPDFHGEDGRRIEPGQMGENVTTVGIDLLGLGRGTWLRFVGDSDGEESGDGKCEKAFLDVLVHATFFAIIIAGLVMRADSKYVVAAIIAHIFTILLCIALLRSIQSELGVAVVEITGVRQPCRKIDEFRKWLKEKCFVKNGKMIVARKAGIMGVVESGGVIRPGMRIVVEPAEDFQELKGLP